MPKRHHEDEPDIERTVKRPRSTRGDRLSRLSDEVLLRILSFLSIDDLNTCQRLSRKHKSIAADSQLWKALYYNRFVKPRASRLPGIRDPELSNDHLHYSSKLSKWLDEENLVKRGKETNWKRQYKLRHNWTRGACKVEEMQVAERPPLPPLLVRMHEGVVYTVDSVGGLRAWNSKKERGMLAKATLPSRSPPTALAIDVSPSLADTHKVSVGFEDGTLVVYEFDRWKSVLNLRYQHPASSNGMLSAVAICMPYLVTMTASQLLSLYRFEDKGQAWESPRLLHSLRSHTTWPPLSLAIRSSSQSIIATIAYAIPTFSSGWSVGVQEMWLSPEGVLLDSRLATSTSETRGIITSLPSSLPPSRIHSPMPNFAAASPGFSKPTSLSYSHPYLLLSHPDNTLTLYMVTSTDRTLSIGSPSRLWGHTSSVSGAHVGGRGKAVSVSTRGDELRIWELEGSSRRKIAGSEMSVRVQSPHKPVTSLADLNRSIAQRGDGLGLALESKNGMDDMSIVRGWVGFDEENVVILREKSAGSQALVVYDFT
jgi:hypothetical protein